MDQYLIAPSILAADFANLQSELEMLDKSQADCIHVDIMDGVFVPNISFGFSVTAILSKYTSKPLDFHLMVQDPNPYLQVCKDHGAATVSVHYEACQHLHRTIQSIKALGMKAGVAINPHTNVEVLRDMLSDIDVVLLMSVNPGFGGQQFIERTYSKIKQIKTICKELGTEVLIEIDGGVSLENAKTLKDTGANILVAGSFVFNSTSPVDTIKALKNV
ncbi:ribulose-phosphate 3-epimerase [Marinoscillum sp. MHG1-6]|uniref:ribulose-phosphate 3-epimerase n=1 Tax=Marinoscillum sp. MHG1-6 TaxID=2959627 RepID=UPI002157E29F|nr:ribulose-phosphate 3-epimerase [Marinoscillum sp. MHG1-6]